ncbi:hypothetical protein PFUGPA_04178 [Plasmodium falciparum Palo Alto/Uganda]|uniref:C2H2-type domain-containing protein n=1 Tax=Plasmodium falciparum (isolate Palo Alto / Uganda) TaxID=57270 RepID=W4IWW9_PLAFP|nr:hypothetical protein PFUGPA_04178 [Plasmodium falciparum Palo Alto/Uganda]
MASHKIFFFFFFFFFKIGQFKCFACDIYFINNDAKIQHEKSKKHKRRVKQLNQEKAHTYKDALRAAEITF